MISKAVKKFYTYSGYSLKISDLEKKESQYREKQLACTPDAIMQKGVIMDTNLSLSFELIYLMGWLLKNEKSMLNDLVKHAVKNGLAQDLQRVDSYGCVQMSDELYGTILDFLSYLEKSLAKNLDANIAPLRSEEAIFPTLKKLDQENLDLKNIKLSIQKARDLLNKNIEDKDNTIQQTELAKNVLFEHILKGWKPSKGDLLN